MILIINGDVFYHDFSFELLNWTDSTYEINNLSVVSATFVKEITLMFLAIKTELELT